LYYPEAWPFLEFCLAGKSILNIEGITLPFMGVILSAPASMKTMIIQLFRKYPGSFYTDSFTPNSLVSHNSAFTEEELQRIDMLPKMKDKLVLASELAPIFTAKDDDLQKILGMVTRILDGHGFENDSGAQGHRRYGDTMFVWLGAAVEIPPKVWRLLGTLGHKIYFLRPALRKKTPQDLKRIAKHNNFSANNKEIEDALLDYLKTFDAVPEVDGRTRVDEKGIVKIRWNEEIEQEQDTAIGYIAQIANLLAPLRGTVYLLESRYATINHHKYTGNNTNDEQQKLQQSYTPQIPDGQDYDADFPTIEDPSRAVILLRNLAIGHAISQGRDSIILQDVRIPIKVALSTAMVHRVKVLDLLLKNKGEVTTSQITKELRISEPTARRTMREFHALGIADFSAVARYQNAELKIILRSEFEWFKSKEFEELREGFVPANNNDGANNDNNVLNSSNRKANDDNNKAVASSKITGLSYETDDKQQKDNQNLEACDSHTLKAISTPETEKKNNNPVTCDTPLGKEEKSSSNDKSSSSNKNSTSVDSQGEKSNSNIKIDCSSDLIANSKSEEDPNYNNNNNQQSCDNKPIEDISNNAEKNDASFWGFKHFQHVTQSHGHKQSSTKEGLNDAAKGEEEGKVLEEILATIKDSNSFQIAVNSAIQSTYNRNEQVRAYLGDKLTQRENKRVKTLCLKINRHPNIEVVKYKPQLIVRWTSPQTGQDSHDQPITNHENAKVSIDEGTEIR
jgi:hypothetical protein